MYARFYAKCLPARSALRHAKKSPVLRGIGALHSTNNRNRSMLHFMTLCPVAIVVGCKKCPAFSICPLKSVIGDQGKPDDAPAGSAAGTGERNGQAKK